MVAAFDPRYKLSPWKIVDRLLFVGACMSTSVTFGLVPCMYLELALVSIQAPVFSLLSRVNMDEYVVASRLSGQKQVCTRCLYF